MLEELVNDIKQLNNLNKVNEVYKELSDVIRHFLYVAELNDPDYHHEDFDESIEGHDDEDQHELRPLGIDRDHLPFIKGLFLKQACRICLIIYPNM